MGLGSAVVGLAVLCFCCALLCGWLIVSGYRRMRWVFEERAWRRDQVWAAKRLTLNPEERADRKRLADGVALMEAMACTLAEIHALPETQEREAA